MIGLRCFRSELIALTKPDTDMSLVRAISWRLFQKASSTLMLVLCPAMTSERLGIADFCFHLPGEDDTA
jgi:hypothetical protein